MLRFQHGGAEGHVESVFIKLNLGEARAFWLKLTFLRRDNGAETVEAWAIAFNLAGPEGPAHRALKKTSPARDAACSADTFRVEVDGITWTHGHLVGELRDARSGDRVSWDLRYTPNEERFHHLPFEWMYEGAIPQTKALSPQVNLRFDGEIRVNNVTSPVAQAPGMLGHNWGRRHAESWTWAHCNQWGGAEQVVFEGVTSRVLLGRYRPPRLSVMYLAVADEVMELNGLWRAFAIRSRPRGLTWRFLAKTRSVRIEGRFEAPPDRFAGVVYEDPDGEKIHCLNSKIADGALTIQRRTYRGWRPWLDLRCERGVALEIGDRANCHGVTTLIG